MLSSNRVIWKHSSTLTDLSVLLNNFISGSKVLPYQAGNYIYVGSDVPFNHRYFNLSVPNTEDASVTVEIWDGNSWIAAVDIVDFTQGVSGKVLSQNGIIQWATDKSKTWLQERSTEDMTSSGLETLKIYNMYWVRVSLSATLNTTFEVKYVGHKFSSDDDLKPFYPDLLRSNVMNGFLAGKTNWDEQHIAASEFLFNDLRTKRELWAKSQIFGWEAFSVACSHKVAEIVYNAFGEEYEGRRDKACDDYNAALEGSLSQGIDKDEDGHIDIEEQSGMSIGILRR